VTTQTHAEIKITRLECVNGAWRFAFSCSDTDAFERIVEAVKALPLITRRWDPRSKHWLITDEGMRLLAAANPALWEMMDRAKRERADQARQAEERRARERRRAQEEEQARWREQFRASDGPFGYRPNSYSSSIPPAVASALRTLYVTPNAPFSVIQAAYRALAKEAHPDAGGSHERMKAINIAFDAASAWAKSNGRASA
jgi:DnaJ-domain-containing protein 1